MSNQSPAPIPILLVEDNPADIRLVQEALKDAGVDTRLQVVRDGVEALDRLQGCARDSRLPRLILLDLNLPRLTGDAVLGKLRADPTLRHIPVLVITVSQIEDEFLREYGVDRSQCLGKPVDFRALAEAIRAVTS